VRRSDHSSRGVLLSVVYLRLNKEGPWPNRGSCTLGKNIVNTFLVLQVGIGSGN
jgi:hypothetical protein